MHRSGAPAKDGKRRDAGRAAEDKVSRRHALIAIGKYAAYVTPAMTVLLKGHDAAAAHKCGNPGDPQVPSHSCV